MNLINQSFTTNKFAGVHKIILIKNFAIDFLLSPIHRTLRQKKRFWVINEVREFNKIQYAKCKHT